MRTWPGTRGGSGAGCFGEPGPGSGQQPRPAGRRLCRRGAAGLRPGAALRPAAPPPPGAKEPGVGRGHRHPLLVRCGGLYAGLRRGRHRGRGTGLRGLRHPLRSGGLFPAGESGGAEPGGPAGADMQADLEISHPPVGALEGRGKKILEIFQKTLSFSWNMVYNNRETWSKVRVPKS